MSVESLIELLEGLNAKQNKINSIIEMFGADENGQFLEDEIVIVEKMIVQAVGGNEGHYEYISSCNRFFEFECGEISKEELVAQIKVAIENDWTGSIPMIFSMGV